MSSATCLVSFVVACKNSSSRIQNLLNSIYRNCPHGEYEILIADAMSTDTTIDIINYYSSVCTHVVSRSDTGIYNAWNKCISCARGDWLIFLGDDDEIFSHDQVLSSFKFLSTLNPSIDQFVVFDAFLGSPINKSVKPRYNPDILWMGIKFFHPSSALSRQVFLNYKFDESLRIVADYKLFSVRKPKAIYCQSILTKIGQNGISQNSKLPIFRETLKVNIQVYNNPFKIFYYPVLFLCSTLKRFMFPRR